jgi:thiol-disulfide isomerase/thioredoxin
MLFVSGVALACLFVMVALGAMLFAQKTRSHMGAMPATSAELNVEGTMPQLDGAVAWLNSEPLNPTSLRGKVVLVEFWTYTCINWRRQFPYVRAWAEKYKDKGVVVIGVHTPEFVFERDIANVRREAKEIKVDFPIAVDSDYAIWQAFNNEYWPALYFVDAQGRIRHHQFGEGDYEQSEKVIKQLLVEAGATGVDDRLVSANGQGPEAPADWNDLRSPENYTGYRQAANFSSAGGAVRDQPHTYAVPTSLSLNHWGLAGDWTVTPDRTVLNNGTGHLTYRFHARDVHLVMGPSASGKPVRFRVSIAGQAPGAAHGTDIDAQGNGTVSAPRMYQLIRQSKPIADRDIEIEFLDAGAQAFCFTFG